MGFKIHKEKLFPAKRYTKINYSITFKKRLSFGLPTCTIAPEENEAIVHFVLSNFHELQIQEINLWMDFIKNWINSFEKQVFRKYVNKSIRCIPNTETEWFFIAKFKSIKKSKIALFPWQK